MDNDANVAAFGEARLGAGSGRNPVFYVTLGSGVGGGLSLLGEPLRAAVAEALPPMVMEAFQPAPGICLATLREDAVPVGALLLAGALG